MSWLLLLGLWSGQEIPTPAAEARAAIAYLARVPAEDRVYTRFLTTANLPKLAADDALQAARFWLNSLSRSRRLRYPVPVTETLWKLDLRDYGWSKDAWDRLATKDPYYFQSILGVTNELALREGTNCSLALLRLDFFLSRTAYEPHYSDFLRLGKTLAELKTEFRVRDEDVEVFHKQVAAGVQDSDVSLHKDRQVEYRPFILGAFWFTRDTDSNAGDGDILEGKNLVAIKAKANEIILNLPNGLQAYALVDAKGNLIAEADPKIVADNTSALPRRDVRTALSCVVCHPLGINPVKDVVAPLIRGGRYRVGDPSKERTEALEDLYLPGLDEHVKDGQTLYARKVKECNGLEPPVNAKLLETVVYRYLEQRVDLATGAAELGVDPRDPRLRLVTRGSVVAMLAGQAVRRESWEDVYADVARVLAGLGPRPPALVQPPP